MKHALHFRVADLGHAIAYYAAMFAQLPATGHAAARWTHPRSRASLMIVAAASAPGRTSTQAARAYRGVPQHARAALSRGRTPPRQHP